MHYSFPSGHSFSSFVFCSIAAYLICNGTLSYLWKSGITFLLLSFSLAIGLSRLVLNVHYATDVTASFLLAVIWLIISFAIISRIQLNKPGFY